jgi:phosphopantothenoylcysteine synthetase/decarboxylase
MISNSSATSFSVTVPASCRVAHISAPGSKSLVVTNGGLAELEARIQPGVTTNIYFATPY